MKAIILIIFNLFVVISLSCQEQLSEKVPFNSDKIYYEGRIAFKDSMAEIYWTGSLIEINFKGTGLKAILSDNNGDNYYNVIIDDDSIWGLRPLTVKTEIVLASGLADKEHNLKLYKRTEWDRGTTCFYGFKLDKGTVLLPPPAIKKREIEFFGNSITAGYGIEDYSGKDRSDSIFTNNYLTYAALTARHFNAKCHYTVKSGIGILVSWFPLIMPELYDRLDPNNPESKWDFASYTPDIVVINLFQNDSWILNMPKSKEYKYRFGNKPKPDENKIVESYIQFIRSIREKYPNSKIICMLGTMDITEKGSPWPGYVQKAVDTFNDKSMFTLFVPYKNTPGHPKVKEQEALAKRLIEFIEKNIKW